MRMWVPPASTSTRSGNGISSRCAFCSAVKRMPRRRATSLVPRRSWARIDWACARVVMLVWEWRDSLIRPPRVLGPRDFVAIARTSIIPGGHHGSAQLDFAEHDEAPIVRGVDLLRRHREEVVAQRIALVHHGPPPVVEYGAAERMHPYAPEPDA